MDNIQSRFEKAQSDRFAAEPPIQIDFNARREQLDAEIVMEGNKIGRLLRYEREFTGLDFHRTISQLFDIKHGQFEVELVDGAGQEFVRRRKRIGSLVRERQLALEGARAQARRRA